MCRKKPEVLVRCAWKYSWNILWAIKLLAFVEHIFFCTEGDNFGILGVVLLPPPLVYISALSLSFLPFFVAGPPPLLPECWNVPRANVGKRPVPLEKPAATFVVFFSSQGLVLPRQALDFVFN